MPATNRATKGKVCYFKLDSTTVENIGEWTLTRGSDIVDTTAIGDSFHKKEQTINDWSASVTGFFDPDDTNGQKVLEDAYFAGTLVQNVRFYEKADVYYKPDTATDCNAGCFIESIETSRDAAGVVAVTMAIAGTGPILRVDV